MIRSVLFSLMLCLALCGCTEVPDRTALMEISRESVPRYDFVEIVVRVENPAASNPFWDARLTGSFGRVDRAQVAVEGFCDSEDGTVYRIRYCPNEPGPYEFSITFSDDSGTEVFSGTFDCTDGPLQGFLRRNPDHPRHFIREGTGKPFYPIGNTAYGILGLSDMGAIKSSLDYFKTSGVNRVRLQNYARFIDGEFGIAFDSTWNGHLNAFSEDDHSKYNLEHWQKMEEILRYMRDREMIASVIMTIDRGAAEFPKEGSADEERYYRYAVARYAAFSNVTFDLGNEHNEYREVPGWANQIGMKVHDWSPYDNMLSAHAYEDHVYKNSPQTSWCGWQEFQHYGTPEQVNAHIIANLNEAQPAINEEYGYEGSDPIADRHGQTHDLVRQKIWAIACAGGYSTYGDWHEGAFVTGKIGPGLAMADGYLKILSDFFEERPYWLMHPDNSLVSDGFALRKGNQELILYCPAGGGVSLSWRDIEVEERFEGIWLNPSTGESLPASLSIGSEPQMITAPDSGDWVLHLAAGVDK